MHEYTSEFNDHGLFYYGVENYDNYWKLNNYFKEIKKSKPFVKVWIKGSSLIQQFC